MDAGATASLMHDDTVMYTLNLCTVAGSHSEEFEHDATNMFTHLRAPSPK